jgi:hypothetical protein
MTATLEKTATSPDAKRWAEKAININKQTMSAAIEDPDTIIRMPDGAKGVRGISGRAHFEFKNVNSHTPIPAGAMYVQYTEYYKGLKNIAYGPPAFYDENGNKV